MNFSDLKSISKTFYKQLLRQYSFATKIQNLTVIGEKLRKALLYEKVALKMKTKSTPALNFINIIRPHFSYESLFKAKTYLEKAAETTFV